MRVTRLNGCGSPVPGSQSVVVSTGVISVEFTANTEEGEAIQVPNFNGDLCINDTPAPKFTGYGININLCGVDPNLVSLLTGQPLVYNDATTPEVTGFKVNSRVDLDASGFALELWTGIAGSACDDGDQTYGYLLFPYIKGGVLGDFTVENGAVNFVISGAQSKDGTAWGVGPYDVLRDNGGDPSPLFEALDSYDHLYLNVTPIAPPTAQCGAQPLGVEATTATAGIPATLTPANSYPPLNVADANAADLLTASPTTAWTTGQYVEFEDGSTGHWDGTTWVAGAA
jgi:hypothetical protein